MRVSSRVGLIVKGGILAIGGLALVAWLVVPPSAPVLTSSADDALLRRAESARAAKVAAARERWPFESLVERLPSERKTPTARPLGPEATARWEIFDRNVAAAGRQRTDALRALHEQTRDLFLDSPGAGSGRVWMRTDESILLDEKVDLSSPSQPGPPADFPASPGEPLTTVPSAAEFHFYHDGGLSDFLYPEGFGYMRDRNQVAGFQAHGFRYLGVAEHEKWRWRVQHILLIGMMRQESPVVYLTDRLPSMEQIREGKTRAPDLFETAGLAALKDGEDLYLARKGDTVRMLGAVRATRTCQQCHDVSVGQMLGSLSYTLRPAPRALEKSASVYESPEVRPR